jgi:hypothetical protein
MHSWHRHSTHNGGSGHFADCSLRGSNGAIGSPGITSPLPVRTKPPTIRDKLQDGHGTLATNDPAVPTLSSISRGVAIQRPMIPLLAGVTPEEMRGPHRVLNALSCSNESQLIQFVEDTGRELRIDPQSSSSYLDKVRNVKKLSESIETRSVGNGSTQEMIYEESVYWKTKNGKRDGPYCPNCYDDESKVVHLNPGATKGTYGCGACRNSFRTNEYNSGPSRRRPFSSR